MRDNVSDVSANVMIASATYSADTTPIAIDLAGYEACTILIEVGAGGITFTGSNKVEFVLTDSDDNSSYANVTAANVIHPPQAVTSGIVYALTSAHASATVVRLGYEGGKRYLKLLADFSGTHGAGTPISAVAVLGRPVSGPIA